GDTGSAPTAPTAPPNPSTPMSLQDFLKQFQGPESPGVTAAADAAQAAMRSPSGLATAQGSLNAPPSALQSYLTQGLSRVNALPQPTFQEMYQNWRTVADREAARQAANINEAFGTQGARYSQDLLNTQRDLRERQTQDLALAANQIEQQLEQQRV